MVESKSSWLPLNKDIIKHLKDKSDPRVAESAGFKKVREDIEKTKKRGKMIIVGDLVKDHENDKDPKKKKVDPEAEDGEEDTANLSREERKKKYMERADVVESINVAADLALELKSPNIQIGAKKQAAEDSKATETN